MLIRGDARHLPLRTGCVACVITSPPYFGLRDYGTPGQLGLELTPDDYVAELVAVFREVRRMLRMDGTCWVNLGDTYTSGSSGMSGTGSSTLQASTARCNPTWIRGQRKRDCIGKPKNLIGIPWRVAFALQADGWYLRADIIWSKPNPMPESVTDRPTKAHEYLFLLAKSERYYYDANAIREAHKPESLVRYEYGLNVSAPADGYVNAAGSANPRAIGHCVKMADNINPLGRNRRSVWQVPTMPYSGAHFATMPEALVEPCILAGCPLGGLVLDPFVGSGTVVSVAQRLGRRAVGLDLSYQDLARTRTAQRGLPFMLEAP